MSNDARTSATTMSAATPAEPGGKPQGRPPALDETKQATVCALIAVGCSRRQAAEYVGCSPATIANLAKRDAPFAEQLRQALLQREVTPLKNVVAASGRSWRAGAWLLERRYPERYGRRQPGMVSRGEMVHFAEKIGRIICNHIRDPLGLEQVESDIQRMMREVMSEVREAAPRA